MKIEFLMIISVALFTSTVVTDQVFALCAEEINYDAKLKDSELVFTGTVTRLDNYDGPQRVTFFIHDVIKGQVDTPKHVLENSGKIFHDNDSVTSSSVSVDYEIGKTYKVYVENGDVHRCTTKQIPPPAGYMWEPGPEDGNYYSENPTPVYTCEDGYGWYDGICITLEEMNRDLPTCDPNPKHDFGKCKKGNDPPDNTLQDVLNNCSCQESGQDCIEPLLRWWNATHFIDNIDCEFLDKVEGSPTYGQAIAESIQEPEPSLSTNQLDEMCRNGQALCRPPIANEPYVTMPGNNLEIIILILLVGGIGVSFILGIIYWWKRK